MRALRATLYYRHRLKALPEKPDVTTWKGWPCRLVAEFEGGGSLSVWVHPGEHFLAGIEASALLDLSDLSPEAGSVALSYAGRKIWTVYPWAPYGIGTKDNALIPGRDCAHNRLPFGSRLRWVPPEGLPMRGEIFVADRFGGDQPPDRIDLFTGEPVYDSALHTSTIQVEVEEPWSGVSVHPVKGAQQALNRLGIKDSQDRRLEPDGIWGKNTRYALGWFLSKNMARFPHGIPEQRVPWDPEIFFVLREAAKEVSP